jgi:hypothetical protein
MGMGCRKILFLQRYTAVLTKDEFDDTDISQVGNKGITQIN